MGEQKEGVLVVAVAEYSLSLWYELLVYELVELETSEARFSFWVMSSIVGVDVLIYEMTPCFESFFYSGGIYSRRFWFLNL